MTGASGAFSVYHRPAYSACCARAVAVLFSVVLPISCSAPAYTGAEIQFRIVASSDASCPACPTEEFSNPFTGDVEFRVRQEPDLVIAAPSITRFEAVRIGDSRSRWRASIIVDHDARDRIKELAAQSLEIGTLVLVSVGGEPVDVVPARELGGILVLGRFDSLEEVERRFSIDRGGRSRVIEGKPTTAEGPAAEMRATDEFIESMRRQGPVWDDVDTAIREGRYEAAKRLSEQLE